MGAFKYQALDLAGKKQKGVLEGDSERHVRSQLRDRQLKPLEVVAVVERQSAANKPASGTGLFAPRISQGDLALLTRQLATLVQSNLPLADALQAVSKQTRKPRLESMLLQIRSRVVEGHSLAYALAEFPLVFDQLFRSMVAAGEHAGFLGVVLDRLADHTENSQHTANKVKMAMLYPVILTVVASLVIVALMTFVVPKLISIFQSQQAELPGLTVALIACSDFLSNSGHWLLLAIVLAVFGFKKLIENEDRRRIYHRFLLSVPGISGFVRGVDTARFAATLSILMASGVPLLEGLRIGAAVLSNLVLRDAAADVADRVKEGSSLNKALDQSGEFPPMMVHMIASGEASGELETMLKRSSENQERELDMSLSTMMGVLEPLMIVIMGVLVMLIVLAVLMPIFDMNSLVK